MELGRLSSKTTVTERGAARAQDKPQQMALFAEEGRLRNRGCGGFATGYAYDAENRDLGEGRTRDEDAVGIRVEVRRSDLDPVVEEREQVVGNDPFQGLAVQETQPKPEAIQFWAAQKGSALWLEVIIEIAHKVDGADAGKRQLLMLAMLSEEIEGIDLAEARRVEIAAERPPVVQLHDHLLVGAGWGAKFQSRG